MATKNILHVALAFCVLMGCKKSNDRISFSGTYKGEVKFAMANIESMNYIANKVLHSQYSYVIKGDSLILDKIFPPTEQNTFTSIIKYKNQYKLKRMK